MRSQPLSRYARALALAAHLALIVVLLHRGDSLLSVLAALLLFLPLPGLLRGREYTHSWASMMVAFYCALWLAEGWAHPSQQRLAFAIAGLAALDFVGLVLYVRLRGRERLAGIAG
jgi:uncharacterized membrane protein